MNEKVKTANNFDLKFKYQFLSEPNDLGLLHLDTDRCIAATITMTIVEATSHLSELVCRFSTGLGWKIFLLNTKLTWKFGLMSIAMKDFGRFITLRYNLRR